MLISCTTCPVRERSCETCVVTAFLAMPAMPSSTPTWEAEDHRVLDTLCRVGLVSDDDAADAVLERADYGGLQQAV